MNKLTFREYQKSDAPYFEEIIRKTWQYDLFCSKDISQKMAKMYLLECLSQQTFTQVALLENKPIGIIICENKHISKTPLKGKIMQIKSILSLLLSKNGMEIMKTFRGINDVDKQLLGTQNKLYYGEIVFFAVSADNRGTGVGKALFEKALDYMQTQKIDNFYLYTDTSCNYEFYERQGMQKIAKKTYSVPIKIENEMIFYLYEYTSEENEK